MPDLISDLSYFGVFLAIAGVGFLFLLISLVFGELFEHLGVDADHDFDHGGPSFLSVRGISVFVTALSTRSSLLTRAVTEMPQAA